MGYITLIFGVVLGVVNLGKGNLNPNIFWYQYIYLGFLVTLVYFDQTFLQTYKKLY